MGPHRTVMPFTLLGVVSYVILLLTATGALPVEHIWRLLMIPAYAVQLALVIAWVGVFGPAGEPGWLRLLMLPLGLVPFIGLDYLLSALRRRSLRTHAR